MALLKVATAHIKFLIIDSTSFRKPLGRIKILLQHRDDQLDSSSIRKVIDKLFSLHIQHSADLIFYFFTSIAYKNTTLVRIRRETRHNTNKTIKRANFINQSKEHKSNIWFYFFSANLESLENFRNFPYCTSPLFFAQHLIELN